METVKTIEELLQKAMAEKDKYVKAIDDMDSYTYEKWIPRFEDRMQQLKRDIKDPVLLTKKVEEFIIGYWDGKEKNKSLREHYVKELAKANGTIISLEGKLKQLRTEETAINLNEPFPFPPNVTNVFLNVIEKEEDRVRQLIIGGLPERQSFDLDDSIVEEVLHQHILRIIDKLKIPYRRNGRIKTTDLWKGLIYNALMDIDNLKPVTESDLLNRYKKE